MANIIHSPTDKGQADFMKEQCDKLVRSENRVQGGKGSKQRPTKIRQFRKNWDYIKWN